MKLSVLAKLLPTSENSIAYTHMILFPAGKCSGIRKWIPNAVDFRVNALALMILSAIDVVLSTTKLTLYVIFVVPMFKNDMKLLVRDFICSITTTVKAALAVIHGKNEGLLKLSNYQRLEKIAQRNILKSKKYLLSLQPPKDANEKIILTNVLNKIGLNNYLWLLLKQNKPVILTKILGASNAKTALLDLCILNFQLLTRDNRDTLFQTLGCTTDNFTTAILNDPDVSRTVKNNFGGLAQLQTGLSDQIAAKQQISDECLALIRELPAAEKELAEAQQKLIEPEKELSDKMQLRGLDVFYDEVPKDLEPLRNQIALLRQATNAPNTKKIHLSNVARAYATIINSDIDSILSLSEELLKTVEVYLNPSLKTLKQLIASNQNNQDARFHELLLKIPKALARCEDKDSGESLIMHLLDRRNYELALYLLREDASKISIRTVFYLLENGASLFNITQVEMESILKTEHESLIDLYKEKDDKIKGSGFESLKVIGINLCLLADSTLFIDNLRTMNLVEMIAKASPIKIQPLNDIPSIDVVRDGVALANAVGITDTRGLYRCLTEIRNAHRDSKGDRTLEIRTKHIIQIFENMRQQNKNIDFIKNMLIYLDQEGNGDVFRNYGCIGMKQNVVRSIWNATVETNKLDKTDAQADQNQSVGNTELDKLDNYLSIFKSEIAHNLPVLDAHVRLKWGKTLAAYRNVESADPGTRDFFSNISFSDANQRKWHKTEALAYFDKEYHPQALIAFLRKGMLDKTNALEGGINLALENYLSITLNDTQRMELEPLLTDFNGQYTDFALFCVLINLGYIKF